MATALEEYTTEEQHSVVRSYGQRETRNREMFPVYGGKFLSRKVVHNLIELFSQERLKVADNAEFVAESAETTGKRLILYV
jgi:hypothetical protein